MPSNITSCARGLLLASALGALVAPATAQTGITADSSSALAARAAFAKPIAAADLDQHRGGTQIVKNDMTLSGTTADNVAQQVNTGSNAISAGAFANMSGIPVVIQNSGANVLIQNAVIVHLQLE